MQWKNLIMGQWDAQQAKHLTSQTGQLEFIHVKMGRIDSSKLSSGLHTLTVVCVQAPTHIHVNNNL